MTASTCRKVRVTVWFYCNWRSDESSTDVRRSSLYRSAESGTRRSDGVGDGVDGVVARQGQRAAGETGPLVILTPNDPRHRGEEGVGHRAEDVPRAVQR